MVQTPLFNMILEKARDVKREFGGKHLAASHVAVAVADFCADKYTGLTPTNLQSSVRFEEERLRYLFSKEIKLASYLRVVLSRNSKKSVDEEPFDEAFCERLARLRKKELLSADLLFLCALKELKQPYRATVRSIVSDESILTALQDADENTCDYVIGQIEAIRTELEKKSNEARAIRDWKPAAKFSEAEEAAKQLFDSIQTSFDGRILRITLPGFLRETDLQISVYKVKDRFIVHDNGSAVKSLSARIGADRIQKITELLWGEENFRDGKILTTITEAKSLFYFIQEVVLTANADLYYEYYYKERFGRRSYVEPCNTLEWENSAEEFDASAFLDDLKKAISIRYDENKGLLLHLDTKYCHCSYGIRVLIETLDDNTLRFSDGHKNKPYETGEMLEAFYFGSDEKSDAAYYQLMQRLAEPFGLTFDMTSSIIFPEYDGHSHHHKNPYMLSSVKCWIQSFYRFMNGAVVISVVADRIHYKKQREW
ncbi:MAG: hypothetical protein IJC26_06035 [Clostridia bacterium]|nr:hypothetical protein [Clostridia bacterium]